MTTDGNNNKKTLFFDLDGTLVHSAPDLQATANWLLAQEGRGSITIEQTIQFTGEGVPTLVKRAFQATGDEPDAKELAALTKRFVERYLPRSAELSELYPNVRQTLEQLSAAGYDLAICTNKPEGPALNLMKAMNLTKFFPVLIGGDTIPGAHKPDPQCLLVGIERMGTDPANAVMVGDSEVDAKMAQAAGVPVILMSYGYTKTPLEELNADAIIDDFNQLAGALDALG